jgi:fused signal recognition particle receptor
MSFFSKLKSAISRIVKTDGPAAINDVELEDILIEADFGVRLSSEIAQYLKHKKDIILELRTKLEEILVPLVVDFSVDVSKRPYVVVLAGVNGSGKTTTVAKLAYLLKERGGLSVDIAACDTFRAAATEQLSLWAERLNCRIFKSDTPKDPASVAFEALRESKSDVLIVDTAGRLHNNANLMNELAKVYRTIGKVSGSAPHMNVLIIDATTGQNSLEQVREFRKIYPISGLILTKVDGGAKGGTIVSIAEEFKIPILGVGTGEAASDFRSFSIDKFLEGLI